MSMLLPKVSNPSKKWFNMKLSVLWCHNLSDMKSEHLILLLLGRFIIDITQTKYSNHINNKNRKINQITNFEKFRIGFKHVRKSAHLSCGDLDPLTSSCSPASSQAALKNQHPAYWWWNTRMQGWDLTTHYKEVPSLRAIQPFNPG